MSEDWKQRAEVYAEQRRQKPKEVSKVLTEQDRLRLKVRCNVCKEPSKEGFLEEHTAIDDRRYYRWAPTDMTYCSMATISEHYAHSHHMHHGICKRCAEKGPNRDLLRMIAFMVIILVLAFLWIIFT